MAKYVYAFEEGGASDKFLLGGKGSNLCVMTALGLPVPPGFVISTDACNLYSDKGAYPDGLQAEIEKHLRDLEGKTGKRLGDERDPLLVSVRSGAAFSMPGMMDTVLNLGLNDHSVKGLAEQTGDERFAFDSYRRFLQMFGKVVLDIDGQIFEDAIQTQKEKRGVDKDLDLTSADIKELVLEFKGLIKKHARIDFPQDPREQLDYAVKAVFESWNNKRARDYRRIYKIADSLGTAVNVQTMVFGNKRDGSATGVAFTRDPATGEKVAYGDYLLNAQGEDVVAGIRHTEPLSHLERDLAPAYEDLMKILDKLEQHYRDMCDTEFTIEEGKLYMLQTRIGKRTAAAALRIAVDMVSEGLITKEEAVGRIEPEQLDHLLHPRFDPDYQIEVVAHGLNASPGAAVGKVVFDATTAERLGGQGEKVILTRWETTPDDLHGMVAAQGILTSHGGKTSHAAVVARGMGKPCVVGCAALQIDTANHSFLVDGKKVEEGDVVSIDGTTGNLVLGDVPLVDPMPTPELKTVLGWADEIRRLGVRTNADTPQDAAKAREFGAEGVGLARTEHMFLGDRLPIVQKMILGDSEEKAEALRELLKVQNQDFVGILEAMDGLPVTIRLLDPPLHEFLPKAVDIELEVIKLEHEGASSETIIAKKELLGRVLMMTEVNPMLGLRGCRLGITNPEIYDMQVRAIMLAACEVKGAGGDPQVEIMIPLVATRPEIRIIRKRTIDICDQIQAECGQKISYKIGTMIELPRAAITADEIAEEAEFFSFGTNDLTQTTFGFSRDDIEGKFLSRYLDQKILGANPFEVIDSGVGKMIEIACDLGRKTNPNLKLGICGEHGGDPASVKFFHKVGLDYVSCSPYRVPLARLAAAQATLEKPESTK